MQKLILVNSSRLICEIFLFDLLLVFVGIKCDIFPLILTILKPDLTYVEPINKFIHRNKL